MKSIVRSLEIPVTPEPPGRVDEDPKQVLLALSQVIAHSEAHQLNNNILVFLRDLHCRLAATICRVDEDLVAKQDAVGVELKAELQWTTNLCTYWLRRLQGSEGFDGDRKPVTRPPIGLWEHLMVESLARLSRLVSRIVGPCYNDLGDHPSPISVLRYWWFGR